jgi:hypothetical protein
LHRRLEKSSEELLDLQVIQEDAVYAKSFRKENYHLITSSNYPQPFLVAKVPARGGQVDEGK